MFKVFVIGHLLGDFYFQSDRVAREKTVKKSMMVLHGIIYFLSLAVMAVLFLTAAEWGKAIAILMIVSMLHGMIDVFKGYLEKGRRFADPYVWFLMDQFLHIGILYITVQIWGLQIAEDSLIYRILGQQVPESLLLPMISGLICWKPASVFISGVFRSIPVTASMAEEDQEGAKIGSWIGILEREITLVLGLMHQFGAIGFVLAAKSLARYKQLENKAFAEKYLVGTLLSMMIAILCVFFCEYF